MVSEGTIDGKKYGGHIKKGKFGQSITDELCEEPPEFIDSENNEYNDLIGKSID